MRLPGFSDLAPRFAVRDPLARFLGAAQDGVIEYTYADTVRLAGVSGVLANVASCLTGATDDAGFKGIGGHFDRRGLLDFGVAIAGQIRITRVDTGAAATVSARLDRVPSDPHIAALMPRCANDTATADQRALFQSLWQDQLRALVVEHADDPQIIVVHQQRRSR